MIKIHLSKIMGEKRLKISDVVKATNINRGTITRLYHEQAQRVDLDALDKLCRYLQCQLSELIEWIDE
ncbi:MAG TPA: XRE family transcriptional regulator [Gammaproteobacteria bacterium]|nr:XRE family transcriptional regulator [Gammaproteobacteria bacterium]